MRGSSTDQSIGVCFRTHFAQPMYITFEPLWRREVEVHVAGMTGDRKRSLLHSMCECRLSIFTKIKLLIINRDSSISVFCRCFTFCYYNTAFHRSFRYLRICVFCYLLCRNLAKFVIFIQLLH